MKTISKGGAAGTAQANLTRQQLEELEERQKTPFQKVLDLLISLLPLVAGLAAVLEYRLLPDSFSNPVPNTYLWFLLVCIGLYAVRLLYGLAVLALKQDKRPFQKTRFRAPLYTALFLLLAGYDYLTLKTGILTQPLVPCVNSIMNAAWGDRAMLLTSALHTLRLGNPRREEKHIALSQKFFRTVHIDNRPGIHARRNCKRNTRRNIGLN